MLDPQATDAANWGERTNRPASTHSVIVFDITEFLGQESPSPPTPMKNVVYQLTDAKVHGQPTPYDYDYEPPDSVEPQPVQ